MDVDFIELATFCRDEFKATLNSPEYSQYVKTLFVAIKEDNSVCVSVTPHILSDAVKCILIHQYCSIAVTNWYDWYKVQFISERGEVYDERLDNEFKLSITNWASYSNQVMALADEDNTYYACKEPWERHLQPVWNLYLRLKEANSESERLLISDLFEKDERILELEKSVADFCYKNQLLESEKKQYEEMLDEIKNILDK